MTAAGGRPGRDWLFSAGVTIGALLPRLYVALAWAREPVWDGRFYDAGARRIAEGLGYSAGTIPWAPWSHWPVGYSGFLAFFYKVFGHGPKVATVAGALVSALLVLAVHRFARHWLSPARARLAALLCALHPGLIAYSALVMSEPLAALILLAAGLLALRYRERHVLPGAAAAGLLLGLGTLVRPTFILHAPALGLLHLDLRRWKATAPRALLVASLGAVMALGVVAPWTLRNCRLLDGCAFVSTNGGWNLAIGALPGAAGRFRPLTPSDGCWEVRGQVARDRCYRDRALVAIRDDPARWLALVPRKLGHVFNHESYAIEYLHEADPGGWGEAQRLSLRVFLSFVHRLLLTTAALAILARAPSAKRAASPRLAFGAVAFLGALAWYDVYAPSWPLAVAIVTLGALPLRASPPKGPAWRWIAYSLASVIVTHAIFFGEDRYHIVITPMLCVLAAAAFRPPEVSPVTLPQT